ncbi:MAG: ATP-binding domain-containing protein, partial [Clostridiales bacterium]|nr:ATP-binding domain-containing protein [Clostridiales bacterium]
DFALVNDVLVTKEEIKELFLRDVNHLPVYRRVNEVKKRLANKLILFKDKRLKILEGKYDKDIENLRFAMEPSEERRLRIVALIDERDQLVQRIKKESKTIVKKHIDMFPKKEIFDYYYELMSNKELIQKYSSDLLLEDGVSYLSEKTKELLDGKKIELEDYAPIVYLKHRLFGFKEEISIKSVVIDEAQDFSVFQFYTLKTILNTNMFTILGDISQGIHSYRGISNWEELIGNVFGEKNSNYMTLVQSYRTTIEIMNMANEIIRKLNDPQIILAKPVIRHGENPLVRSFSTKEILLMELENKILEIQNEDFKSIAIICKTNAECLLVKKHFDKKKIFDTKILNEKEESYEAGIILVPSYFAKGLEFDVVMIANVHEEYKEEELDIKLFYVAMTRALHRLYIYHMDNKMLLLDKIDSVFIN